MTELLKAMQEKMGANVREIKEDIKNSKAEMKAKMGSHQKKFMTIKKAGKKKIGPMREAYLEKTKACLCSKELTSGETESVAVHEEFPKETVGH
jgi:hypothetical protein